MHQVRGRVTEPGFGDRRHQAVSDEKQGGGTPDATRVGRCENDHSHQERHVDGDAEPALVQVHGEPVAVDREAVEGLVGQSGIKYLLQPGPL